MNRRSILAGLPGVLAMGGAGLYARSAAAQEAHQSTLDRIRSTGILRVAAIVGEEPYFHKDLATGQWSGACVEMAKDIAKHLNAKPEFIESTMSTVIFALQSRKVDLGFSLSASPDRALAIEFTRPLFIHSFAIIIGKNFKHIDTWNELNKPDVRIAVDLGSTQEIIARRYVGNAQISAFKSTDEGVLSVTSGRTDGIVLRAALAISAKKKNPSLGELIVPKPNLSMATNMGVPMEADKRFRDFLSIWADYNRSLGQIREWLIGGYALLGVTPADIPAEIQF